MYIQAPLRHHILVCFLRKKIELNRQPRTAAPIFLRFYARRHRQAHIIETHSASESQWAPMVTIAQGILLLIGYYIYYILRLDKLLKAAYLLYYACTMPQGILQGYVIIRLDKLLKASLLYTHAFDTAAASSLKRPFRSKQAKKVTLCREYASKKYVIIIISKTKISTTIIDITFTHFDVQSQKKTGSQECSDAYWNIQEILAWSQHPHPTRPPLQQ